MRYYDRMSHHLHRQSGQIALMVLLIMGITMVIAVSLAQRTAEDVALTSKQAETTKVFSAAQSGAEQVLTEVLTALRAGVPAPLTGSSSVLNDSTVQVSVAQATEFTQPLDEGETYQVNLPTSGSVVLEWGEEAGTCDTEASLLISRYYDDGETKVEYFGQSAKGCGLTHNDGFEPTFDAGSDGRKSKFTYDVDADDLFLRVIPVYNSTNLYVEGASGQQYAITANAQNALGEDEETRVVQVTTSDLQPPPFLDYALYSGTTITKP